MRAYSLSCFFFFCKTWNVVKLTIEHKFSQAASTGLELSGFKADQQLQMCTFFLVMKYDLTKLCTIWTVLYTCLIWKFCTWEYIQITRQRMTSFIYRYTYKQNTMKEKHKQLAFCTSYGDRTKNLNTSNIGEINSLDWDASKHFKRPKPKRIQSVSSMSSISYSSQVSKSTHILICYNNIFV